MIKEYVIHAKLKNNLILSRILENYKNVNEFCSENGLRPTEVGKLVNMKGSARNKKSMGWTKLAQRLADVLGVCPEDLFSEEQQTACLRSNEAFIEMSRQQILEMSEAGMDPCATLENRETEIIIAELLDSLSPREAKVLRLRFGIDINDEHTLEEVGEIYDVTRTRIRQIEAKALRKLRHPARLKKLKEALCIGGGPQ